MLTLRSGTSSIVVAPEYGAGLTGWMIGCTPILRRALPQTALGGNPHAMGCFPLLPYGNRIDLGRFRWAGTDYVLARNFGDHPHTIHGIGWQRAWAVKQVSSESVRLSLDHRPDPSWPFAFSAEIGYTLSASGLLVTMQLTNRHHAPAPGGVGVHPYFRKAYDPSLRLNASGAWENDAASLPLRHGPPRADWKHAKPWLISESRLDNCFTGWDGVADIQAAAASVRIEASGAFSQVQVFTPSWADFFCVEPVSHVPNAINRRDLPDDQAMDVLEPGETLGGTIAFMLTG